MYFNFTNLVLWMVLVAAGAGQALAADSLFLSPQHPTTSDSIRLNIVIKSWDCCAQFSYDSTAVALQNDSTIVLTFTTTLPMVDTLCCVPRPIPVLTYKRGPLPAGKYSVEEASQSCFGSICLDSLGVTSIGTFAVTQPNATAFRQKSVPLEDIGRMSGTMRVYNIRGDVISSARASKHVPGIYFVKPTGRSAATTKVWF
jgi:hypothetical protein